MYLVVFEDALRHVGVPLGHGPGLVDVLGIEDDHTADGLLVLPEQRAREVDASGGLETLQGFQVGGPVSLSQFRAIGSIVTDPDETLHATPLVRAEALYTGCRGPPSSMNERAQQRAYGTWPSTLEARRIASESLRLSQPRLRDGEVYWIEGRPSERGRQQLMCARASGELIEISPTDIDVRSRVHEYGGGDYGLGAEGIALAQGGGRGALWLARSGNVIRALTAPGAEYADFAISPAGDWLVAVQERQQVGGEASNRLLAIPLQGDGAHLDFATGFDFVSSPCFSPDGSRLAFLSWQHPDMPWDSTRLHVLDWSSHGPGASRLELGGAGESIFQPGFSPAGVLTYVSDRSGWWNLYQVREGVPRCICEHPADFAFPQWGFAMSSWAYISEASLLCTHFDEGRQRLSRLDVQRGGLEAISLPFEVFEGLRVEGNQACFLAAGPTQSPSIVHLDLETRSNRILRESARDSLDSALISVPEAIRVPVADGEEVPAFLYAPANPAARGSAGERPPLIVKSHGGPTAAARPQLDLRTQFFTSRGFAVVDVNYRGSTGFGRAYRDRLRGEWGVLDVADCVDVARELSASGRVDAERLAISGGSAGGFTTLCALTFHEFFRAGASHYGIGDLEALAQDTHKFEKHYCDALVGPYPEARDLYRARSPIHHSEQLSCPVIFFQGLEDRVVPPEQAEAMVAALAAHQLPHAYVPFEGEAHGFRRSENVAMALEAELWFYGRVFGFPVDVNPDIELRCAG